jgi:hypothetical protein
MATTLLESFNKQPSENYVIALELSERLPSGVSILSSTVSAINYETGAVDNSVIDSLTAVIVGTQAKVRVKAGTSGTTYKLTFVLTLSDGSILEEDLLMSVLER